MQHNTTLIKLHDWENVIIIISLMTGDAMLRNYTHMPTWQTFLIAIVLLNAFKRIFEWSSLERYVICRLLGTKPLAKPLLTYCQLDIWVEIAVKFANK